MLVVFGAVCVWLSVSVTGGGAAALTKPWGA